MLKDLQWYNIACLLRDFINTFRYTNGDRPFEYLVDRDEMKIKVGSGNTGEWPAIWILFGSEEQVSKQDNINGSLIYLWIDIYVKAEAGPDIDFTDNLYNQMFRVEKELVRLLRAFNSELHKRGIGSKLEITHILSDGDDNVSGNALNIALNRVVVSIERYNALNK